MDLKSNCGAGVEQTIDHIVPGINVVLKGIYDFKGDQLRLYFGGQEGERPREFETKEGEKLWLRTLERIETDK